MTVKIFIQIKLSCITKYSGKGKVIFFFPYTDVFPVCLCCVRVVCNALFSGGQVTHNTILR